MHSNLSRIVVAAILGIHTALLLWGIGRQSPTHNEVAHLAAGVSYWQFGRFDVYRVNPPLTRLVAALPVLHFEPKTDWKSFDTVAGARSEFAIGRDFVAANGQRSLLLFVIARWACLPFSWLGAVICYRWAHELYGIRAALLALALWAFCPNILGHAQLATPDVGATALGVAALYSFWKWLKRPTFHGAAIAGITLGLAEVTKFTWLALVLILPAQWILTQLIRFPSRRPIQIWLRELFQLTCGVFVMALLTINLAYGFEGSFHGLDTFPFVSRLLGGPQVADGGTAAKPILNRFNKTLGPIVVPLPKHFVLGIDSEIKDLEYFARASYLRGEFRATGWWYFYLYGLLVKVPIGTWLLGAIALTLIFSGSTSAGKWADTVTLLFPAITMFAMVSSQRGFTIHLRYILPIFPLLYIGISSVCTRRSRTAIGSLAIVGALTWTTVSSLWAFPHNLSYFSEVVGGPLHGSDHLIDSNLDWGQDLLFLREWLAKHPDCRPVYVAYSGGFDPRDIGVNYDSLFGADDRRGLGHAAPAVPKAGFYAISVNFLRRCSSRATNSQDPQLNPREPLIAFFATRRPDAFIGYSIRIYRISSDDSSE